MATNKVLANDAWPQRRIEEPEYYAARCIMQRQEWRYLFFRENDCEDGQESLFWW